MQKYTNLIVYRVCSIFLMALLFCPATAAAQDTGNLFHWAYAPAFGTGVYRIGGWIPS